MRTTGQLAAWLAAIVAIGALGVAEYIARHVAILVLAAVAAVIASYLLGRVHAVRSRRLWPRPAWRARKAVRARQVR